MKIAIILSGDLRYYEHCYLSLQKHVLSHTDSHIYMQFYDTKEKEKALELYKPVKYKCEKREDVIKSLIDCPAGAENIFYQWRNVKESFLLVDEKENYDFILKTRYDVVYTKKLFLKKFKFSSDCINIPDGGDYCGGLFDMVALSSYDNMKYYCSLYDHMNQYTEKSGVRVHPETYLRHHISVSDIPLKRFDYDVELRRLYKDIETVENRFFNIRDAHNR
jgi:hypothetical protein